MTGPSRDELARAVAASLDSSVTTAIRLAGGDVADSYRFELADGRTVFAKTHRAPPPGFFTTEAIGLAWLREPGTVAVPAVLAVSDGEPDGIAFLALEWVDEVGARPTPAGEAEFGRGLARLHRFGFTTFGRPDRRATGSRGLPNEPCSTWTEFYATQRLAPLRRLAAATDALGDRALELLDRVCERLGDLGVPEEPPARLHGDLWAGNRIIDTSGRSWLIDPAAHGGHREFDLAMMRLFGGFDHECFEAYHDEFALADGWSERIPLHQLAPLIVHAIKFRGGYAGAAERALDAALRLG